MSPCFVTRTFTNVNRQYGHVRVDTDVAMAGPLLVVGGLVARVGSHPRSATVVLG